MILLITIAVLLTLAIGISALWANPSRIVNQVFAAISLTTTLWLYFVLMALRIGSHFPADPLANPVPWLRLAGGAGALFPWIIWLLKDAIRFPEANFRMLVQRSWIALLLVLMLAGLAFTEYFIPSNSTPDNPSRGVGYLFYTTTSLILYLVLVAVAYRQMRQEVGVRRIEMQFLTVNCGLACLSILTITAVGSLLDLRVLARLSPLAILVFYALTAWAVTFHRVFDARQVFLALGQRIGVLLVLCFGILGVCRAFGLFLPAPADLLLSIVIVGPLTFLLDRRSNDWLRLSPEQNIAATRRAII